MTGKIKYEFSTHIWQYSSPSGWHFVSLPTDISKEIRAHLGVLQQPWGRIKASAKIGNSEWETAIWFDTKHKTYLLPIKSEIRRKEHLLSDQKIKTTIWI